MTTHITRAQLLADLEKWEETRASWEAEAASSEAEIEGIRARMGEAVLADERQAAVLTTKVRELGDRVDVARRTAAAAEPKVAAARKAVLLFDASEIDREVLACEKVLQAHRAKTKKLLGVLEKHEGRFVPQAVVPGPGDVVVPPKSQQLELDLKRAQLRAEVLRAAAGGQDPMDLVRETYGYDGTVLGMSLEQFIPRALWGPDAVAPLPIYAGRVERARGRLAQLEEQEYVDVEPQIAELEGKIAALQDAIKARLLVREPTEEEAELLDGWRYLISELRGKAQKDAALRAEIEAELEALTRSRVG